MRNHDVIEGIVALAEARETYPYDHFRCVNCAMETCDLNVAEFHDYHIGTCRKRPKASRLALSSSDGGHDIRFNTEHEQTLADSILVTGFLFINLGCSRLVRFEIRS